MTTFGFIKLGPMGGAIVANAIISGERVIIWDSSIERCNEFEIAGAEVTVSPLDLIQKADIIFLWFTDSEDDQNILNIILDNKVSVAGKSYVEMAGVDNSIDHKLSDRIEMMGGRYLFMQSLGSMDQAVHGNLMVLAAGNLSIFQECYEVIDAMSNKYFYLGELLNAWKLYVVLNLIASINMAGIAEGLTLAENLDLNGDHVLDIIRTGALTSQFGMLRMGFGNVADEGILSQAQTVYNCSALALSLGDSFGQQMPLTVAAMQALADFIQEVQDASD